MRYSVTLSCTGNSFPVTEQKAMLLIMEQAVLPTIETLSKWEREKRIHGGCVAGAREINFVIDANSNEEVSELVHALPLWSFVKTEIKPLESFEFRFNQDRKILGEIKKHY